MRSKLQFIVGAGQPSHHARGIGIKRTFRQLLGPGDAFQQLIEGEALRQPVQHKAGLMSMQTHIPQLAHKEVAMVELVGMHLCLRRERPRMIKRQRAVSGNHACLKNRRRDMPLAHRA